MPRIPVRRVMASPTVAPAFTFSRIRGGYANPGPCPTVIRPERSTTAQYWTSKWSERTDDHTSPASMPTPKSPPPIADFARFIAPWTASSSNGWSETSVFTRTPRTRAGRESAWKTSFTARIFTGLFEPMNTCSGLRRLPRRSISPSRMRREAIGRPSWARTIRSIRHKNVSGRETALVDREKVGEQRVGGLSQRRLALDDLQLPQHVSPHDEGARRAVHGGERVFEREGFQGYGGLHGPTFPPSASDELHAFACRPRRLDPFRRHGGDPLPRHPFRAETASHQDVGQETRLHGRVPTLEVHRRLRLEEAHVPRRLDSVLVRPAPLHHGEDQVRRAVQDPLERQDSDAAERLLKQVEHRGAVHHGPLVSEAESLRSGQLFEASVVVGQRAFVRGDHMLATREGRDDVVHADLPRGDPQGRDLDHDVGPGAADVFGRPSVDPA